MTTPKHTPAPWEKSVRHKTSINAGTKHIAMVNWFKTGGLDDVSGEEHEANVNLILAAPELLAALILAQKFCGSLTSDICGDDIHIPIRAAIAKVTESKP